MKCSHACKIFTFLTFSSAGDANVIQFSQKVYGKVKKKVHEKCEICK